ncbi:SGNH/GDSL hydrolase family protein [Brevundimonas intermedia]|uniref:SGNH/GDSL hydrolase family protein n=1 Tax=Brevundimonas intermedia TaxID=74315 RepID=UPI0032AFCF4E
MASNPGAGSPAILTLGDSIAYRSGLYWQHQALTEWGYTPSWIGTLVSRGATDDTATGGKNGEVKPGHQLGDFTYQTAATVSPLPSGDEAAYVAMTVENKRLKNTLLRAPTAGDAAEDIVNGQVMDFSFYITRHGLTPATLLQLSLWTNDINALTLETIYDRIHDGYALLFRRWRAYHATHPIIVALPGTARIPAREALWPNYIEAIRAVWTAVNEADDPNIHLVSGWAQVAADGGYDLTPSAATPDPITSGVLRTIADGVHPTGAARVETWRTFAAAVAYATTHIV